MRLTLREAERIFNVLRVVPRKSTRHVSGTFVVDGIRSLVLHYPHGRGEMPPAVVHKFRRSLHLNVEEFLRLRDGDMTRDEYVKLLLARLESDLDE